MQAPAQARSANGAVFYTPDGKPLEIRDVWAETLEEEMAFIRELVVAQPTPYSFVAMVMPCANCPAPRRPLH
jgi:hypothetical protein